MRLPRSAPSLAALAAALVLVSSGTTVAATQITSGMIKNGTIRLKDISPRARAALRGNVGPQGQQGARGPQGIPGTPGTSIFNTATLPSGVTVRGVWGGRYISAIAGAQQNSYLLEYSFPLPSSQLLTDADVQFGAATAQPVADNDPACTGTVANPTAPAGKVCIYVNEGTRSNATLTGFSALPAAPTSGADAFGFAVRIINMNDPGTTSSPTIRAEGTWAYTAP